MLEYKDSLPDDIMPKPTCSAPSQVKYCTTGSEDCCLCLSLGLFPYIGQNTSTLGENEWIQTQKSLSILRTSILIAQ